MSSYVNAGTATDKDTSPTGKLMKIAADLASRKPLGHLYRICETQGRINSNSLHEHLDKAGDLLAGAALDIWNAIAKVEPDAWLVVSPDGKEWSELQSSRAAAEDLAHEMGGDLHPLHQGPRHEVRAVFFSAHCKTCNGTMVAELPSIPDGTPKPAV